MRIWLTSLDGKINYPCEADTVEDAFHAFAVSVGFENWKAFSAETGYSYRDVTAARLEDERKVYEPSGEYVTKQQESAIAGVYRWLLRNRT